ncbi:MAG: hypothetical protein IH948_02850 [Bacteroidetes bacterium]|nr:hypothetical protein [Bacteroidota bacterium]
MNKIIISVIALFLVVGSVSAVTLNVDELRELFTGEEAGEETLGIAVTQPQPEGRAVLSNEAFDLVGTRTGTTVVPFVWGGNFVASTVFPILLDSRAEVATFTINADTASSAAGAYFSVFASNDRNCDTATTSSPILNQALASEINWFDASSHILNLAGSSSITNETTTIPWEPLTQGINKQISLWNLNSRCLALEVNASSTALWIQFKQASR